MAKVKELLCLAAPFLYKNLLPLVFSLLPFLLSLHTQ